MTTRPSAAQLRLLRWMDEDQWIETSTLTFLVAAPSDRRDVAHWRRAHRHVYAMCRRLVADGLVETQIPSVEREWRLTSAASAALTAAEGEEVGA